MSFCTPFCYVPPTPFDYPQKKLSEKALRNLNLDLSHIFTQHLSYETHIPASSLDDVVLLLNNLGWTRIQCNKFKKSAIKSIIKKYTGKFLVFYNSNTSNKLAFLGYDEMGEIACFYGYDKKGKETPIKSEESDFLVYNDKAEATGFLLLQILG